MLSTQNRSAPAEVREIDLIQQIVQDSKQGKLKLPMLPVIAVRLHRAAEQLSKNADDFARLNGQRDVFHRVFFIIKFFEMLDVDHIWNQLFCAFSVQLFSCHTGSVYAELKFDSPALALRQNLHRSLAG